MKRQILGILALNAVVWGIYIFAAASDLPPGRKVIFIQAGVVISLGSAIWGMVKMVRR